MLFTSNKKGCIRQDVLATSLYMGTHEFLDLSQQMALLNSKFRIFGSKTAVIALSGWRGYLRHLQQNNNEIYPDK